jgi:hypothetical protein
MGIFCIRLISQVFGEVQAASGLPVLGQGGGKRLGESAFLLRKYGPQIDDDGIVLHPGNDGSGRSAAKPLFDLRS